MKAGATSAEEALGGPFGGSGGGSFGGSSAAAARRVKHATSVSAARAHHPPIDLRAAWVGAIDRSNRRPPADEMLPASPSTAAVVARERERLSTPAN